MEILIEIISSIMKRITLCMLVFISLLSMFLSGYIEYQVIKYIFNGSESSINYMALMVVLILEGLKFINSFKYYAYKTNNSDKKYKAFSYRIILAVFSFICSMMFLTNCINNQEEAIKAIKQQYEVDYNAYLEENVKPLEDKLDEINDKITYYEELMMNPSSTSIQIYQARTTILPQLKEDKAKLEAEIEEAKVVPDDIAQEKEDSLNAITSSSGTSKNKYISQFIKLVLNQSLHLKGEFEVLNYTISIIISLTIALFMEFAISELSEYVSLPVNEVMDIYKEANFSQGVKTTVTNVTMLFVEIICCLFIYLVIGLFCSRDNLSFNTNDLIILIVSYVSMIVMCTILKLDFITVEGEQGQKSSTKLVLNVVKFVLPNIAVFVIYVVLGVVFKTPNIEIKEVAAALGATGFSLVKVYAYFKKNTKL